MSVRNGCSEKSNMSVSVPDSDSSDVAESRWPLSQFCSMNRVTGL
jgi:hypothetical protein